MVEFIYAKKLKMEYSIFANFYNIITNNQSIIPCRNVLQIYHNDCFDEEDIDNLVPDALFVLLNPGSAKLNEDELDEKEIPNYDINELSENLIDNTILPTHPDNTQYQVMRVMKEMGWKFVRVINLSDIIATNKKEFIIKFKNFEVDNTTDVHSIFSERRKEERDIMFYIKDEAPIIVGWSFDCKVRDLATRCIRHIPKEKIIGVSANLYMHPTAYSRQQEWLNEILGLLTIEE